MKSSDFIIALVIYTGIETKLRLNNGKFSFKQSTMEKGFNRMVIFFVFLIIALIIIFSSLLYRNITTKGIHMIYIYPEDPIPAT